MKTGTNTGNDNGIDRRLKDQFGNKMPFEVPHGYFESFPERVMASIKERPARHLPAPLQRKLLVAASMLILAAISLLLILNSRQTSPPEPVAFSAQDIYMSGMSNLAELEDAYLLSLVEEENLNLTEVMTGDTNELSRQAIIDYLLAENHIEYYLNTEY
jgi:hypothetical protein